MSVINRPKSILMKQYDMNPLHRIIKQYDTAAAAPHRIINALENHSSRLDKERIILDQAQIENKEFFEGCRLALDSMITFGVRKIPERSGTNGRGVPWKEFALAAAKLRDRELTGHAARDMIIDMMKNCTNAQWNDWYRRILMKDLRCGVSQKTINAAVFAQPRYSIPVFACQLAHDSANHETKVSGRKRIEVKLDGVRVITIVYPDGRVDQLSRNGKELLNFEHIKEQLRLNAATFTEPMVLDGEVMSSSFQDLMKQVHRKENVRATDAVLWLFDALPLSDFERGICNTSQHDRSDWLNDWYNSKLQKNMANVRCLDHAVVNLDTDEGKKLFSMYNRSAIENGYEGIMIKDLDAPYECKRSVSWLKLKPFIEVSLTVIKTEEGTGKYCGSLGALVCSGVDEGKHITVNVGSGFSDVDRDQFWRSRDITIGQIVEIRGDSITKNQDGTYSLRFPRFIRFRGFQRKEKL